MDEEIPVVVLDRSGGAPPPRRRPWPLVGGIVLAVVVALVVTRDESGGEPTTRDPSVPTVPDAEPPVGPDVTVVTGGASLEAFDARSGRSKELAEDHYGPVASGDGWVASIDADGEAVVTWPFSSRPPRSLGAVRRLLPSATGDAVWLVRGNAICEVRVDGEELGPSRRLPPGVLVPAAGVRGGLLVHTTGGELAVLRPRTGVLDPLGPGSLAAASRRYVARAPCAASCPLQVHDLAAGTSFEVPVPAGAGGWARSEGTIVGDRLLIGLVGRSWPNWAAVDLPRRRVVPLDLPGAATLDPTGRWVLAASPTWLSAVDLSTARTGEINRAVALRRLPLRQRGQVVAIEGPGSTA